MGGKITGIQRAGEGSPRLAIFVDGREAFTVSEDVVERLGLEVGMELGGLSAGLATDRGTPEHGGLAADGGAQDSAGRVTDARVPDSVTGHTVPGDDALSERERAREKALALLGVRARSRRELLDRLRRIQIASETATEVVDALEASGLVNDRDFARLWTEERARLKPSGRRKLTQELFLKGIGRDIIDEVLDEAFDATPEIELARRVAARRRRSGETDDAAKERRRLHGLLLRRGFSYEVASKVVDEFSEGLDD